MKDVVARIHGLYLIADTGFLDDTGLAPAVEKALRAGVRVVQYRDKSHDRAVRKRQARALRQLCAHYDACFIVNDDAELAHAVGADGVHLGHNDPSIHAARAVLGENTIVGVSCYNDLARAESAVANSADYVAFGSFYPSRTKPDAGRADVTLLHQARTRFDVPLVAIGGITPGNSAALIAAGADAVAVISGVFGQADVEAAVRRYLAAFGVTQE